MVLEYFSIAYLLLNNFFASHVVLISHMFAAVFLVLTEMTMNMRVITPILDGIEGIFLGNIPLLPSMISALIFIVWATVSIYVYQIAFQWLLNRYENHLTLIILVMFVLTTIGINIKYRD
ncbi:TPA: hypothetical protein HA219_01800 [Candidatus Woesearchaeota archaeon]|nr:hypothetical protein [uncultured archaeon]AQS32099.1 hypothetical protein [uncultured archaeon]MBS3115293.1 hypothetical protein [Candidatus Woesearchaeota archaeon]HIH39434.1 hypothetical protein [Candidatus Woesearchaeota archaeon]